MPACDHAAPPRRGSESPETRLMGDSDRAQMLGSVGPEEMLALAVVRLRSRSARNRNGVDCTLSQTPPCFTPCY